MTTTAARSTGRSDSDRGTGGRTLKRLSPARRRLPAGAENREGGQSQLCFGGDAPEAGSDDVVLLRPVAAGATDERFPEGGRAQGADQPRADTLIVTEVIAALLADPPTRLTVIDVAVKESVVTLCGRVNSAAIYRWAEEVAARQPGVFRVVNALQIEETSDTQR